MIVTVIVFELPAFLLNDWQIVFSLIDNDDILAPECRIYEC